MTGQKEKEEKGEKEEEKKFLRACGRTDGPTKGNTRGPKNSMGWKLNCCMICSHGWEMLKMVSLESSIFPF